ncbi:hypothetical protein KFL_003400140 [Klebsormidium nitens]|uniref:Poly [ADP-ribose] polymerase n=1 Tax=Klebsormidium nitens TaxID=105231 RepID=A0A1Y1IDR0_KLENI|nr:hypothetical protein KFL_003400140 [Klebsormidium nitens]|eukprot:GAQ87241.1 hypothetical protein KFL_003400140 [Klebsormidium nitens]
MFSLGGSASSKQTAERRGHTLKQQEKARRPALTTIVDDASSSQTGSAAAVLSPHGNQQLTTGTGGERKRRNEGRLDKEHDTDVQILGSSAPVFDGTRGQPERKKKTVESSGFAAGQTNPLLATNGGPTVSRSTRVAAAARIAPNPTAPDSSGRKNHSKPPIPAAAVRKPPGRPRRVRAPAVARAGLGLPATVRNVMAGVLSLSPGVFPPGFTFPAAPAFPFPMAPAFPGGPQPAPPIRTATKDAFAALIGSKLAVLQARDDEYQAVAALFKQGDQGHVVAVHKVLNGAARLAAFEEEARAVARVRRQGAKVQQCWHGTSPQALLSILKTGFTASRTVNGKSFGNGLYMAPGQHARTSRGYCQPDDSGVLHMFLLKVILSSVETGRPAMDLPSNPEKYDSAADRPSNPAMFIMWTPFLYSRILLKYVVSFC